MASLSPRAARLATAQVSQSADKVVKLASAG